jgi:hypothetical protein
MLTFGSRFVGNIGIYSVLRKSHHRKLIGIRKRLELVLGARRLPAVGGDRREDGIEIAAMAPRARIARFAFTPDNSAERCKLNKLRSGLCISLTT